MILEGIVTTMNSDGTVRIAAMGPFVEPAMKRLIVRPFTTSRTFENLSRTRQGVFHVTDDAELLARAALHRWDALPALKPATQVAGMILTDACRWYGFDVESIDQQELRATCCCRVVEQGFQREFFGWNRAKHAVLEAAILATRVHLLEASLLREELSRLTVLIEKTGGDAERRAFDLLRSHILESLS